MSWITGKRGGYRVQWRESGRGSAVQSSTTFPDLIQATAHQREVDERLASQRRAGNAPQSHEPLADLLLRYDASRVSRRSARAPWIAESNAIVTRMAEEMKWRYASDITYGSLDAWRSKRPDGRNTDKPLVAVKAFLSWCAESGIRTDQRAILMKAQVRQGPLQSPLLTDEQLGQIMRRAARLGTPYLALIEHLATYGCRPVDVCKCQVKDWNPNQQAIRYRHTKNRLDVTHEVLNEHVPRLNEISSGRGPDEFLFLHRGSPWEIDKLGRAQQLVSWYRNNITKPLEVDLVDGTESGILLPSQLGIYSLKRRAITIMRVAANGNLRAVASITGHKTLGVLDRYTQTNLDSQRSILTAISAPRLPMPPER